MDWDSGGKSEHRAQTRRDRETKCLSWLEPGIPIHLHCSNPPHLTVSTVICLIFNVSLPLIFVLHFLGSGPKRGQSPVEWGEAQPGRSETQPASQASGMAGWASGLAGWASGLAGWPRGGDLHTYVRTENLPILQDFVPFWGRCPKTTQTGE